MTTTLGSALEETAHALGYQSASAFAEIELRNRASQKLAYFKSRVDLYEQKYDMLFDEFMQRVPNQKDVDLKRFSIIEKEDDSMDWDDSLHSLRFYAAVLTFIATRLTSD